MAFKIYTKKGDSGKTSLFGGKKLPKHHLRIEAYGTIDELNASIGTVLCLLNEKDKPLAILRSIQDKLFTVGSNLASDPDKDMITPDLEESDILLLEEGIDKIQGELPELKNFVLPGSGMLNAQLHMARTICRRAERRVSNLAEESTVEPIVLKYLNRLSDFLFVLSRWATFKSGEEELYWNTQS